MLKIVGLQLELRDGRKKENLMKTLNTLKAVADKEREVDFFCLPELFDTGFDYTRLNLLAEEIPGETVNALSLFAEEFGSYIIAGIAEKCKGKIFDSVVLISPKGKVLCVYRKTHLFQEEKNHFCSGDTLIVVNIGKYRIGLQICYEIRFPEISRALTLNGAKIIFTSAAFPLERIDHFMLLAKARAVENQVFHVAVNRVGLGKGKIYGGRSLIVNPLGDVIAGAGRVENVMVGVVDLNLIDDVRRKITALSDRKEEVYGRVRVCVF